MKIEEIYIKNIRANINDMWFDLTNENNSFKIIGESEINININLSLPYGHKEIPYLIKKFENRESITIEVL